MPPITPDEIKALKRPLPLDKHTLREGHKEGGKIRWFIYVDRSAVQDLLDELFPGEWETQEPKMYPVETRTVKDTGEVETSHEMSATMGITIRGLTRWDGGESDDGSTKSAITNAFRRTAAYGWGIARYLYDMDVRIKTDTYSSKGSDGRWQTDWKKYDQVKQQAWDQFVQWYNREFGPALIQKPALQNAQNGTQSSQTPVLSDLQKSADDLTSDAETTVKSPQERLGTPPKQTIAPKSGTAWEYDLPALMSHPDVSKAYPQYEHRANAIKKLHSAGHFESVANISEAVKLLIERPDKVTITA